MACGRSSFYLVATAWLTVSRRGGQAGLFDHGFPAADDIDDFLAVSQLFTNKDSAALRKQSWPEYAG
jgi:hypothetical protein